MARVNLIAYITEKYSDTERYIAKHSTATLIDYNMMMLDHMVT